MKFRNIISAFLLAASLAAFPTYGAISALTIFEIRTTGSDTNGGGFVAGASGTDWSQQDAAQYSVTDGVTNATTTITSATANFGTDVVGNIMYVQGGTGSVTAGWYQITARTNATTITVDRSTGLTAGTGVTLKIGGALASPGQWMGAFISVGGFGADAYIKAGTYSITNTTANTSGGPFQLIGAGTNLSFLEGYQTTRGDLGTKPVLSLGVNGSAQLISTGGNAALVNVECDRNGKTGWTYARGMTTGDRTMFCKFTGAWTLGINASNLSFGYYNWASGCVTGFSVYHEYASLATSCTTSGFIVAGVAQNCIDNASPLGFNMGANSMAKSCTAYGGTGAGFSASSGNVTLQNCLAYGRGGKGFTQGTAANIAAIGCAGGNNTGGNEDIVTTGANMGYKIGFITLSADPFTNAAGGVFTLNSTSGGGAALRGTGLPSVFPAGLTSTAPNVGATENSAIVAPAGAAFTFLQ